MYFAFSVHPLTLDIQEELLFSDRGKRGPTAIVMHAVAAITEWDNHYMLERAHPVAKRCSKPGQVNLTDLLFALLSVILTSTAFQKLMLDAEKH